MSENIKRTSVRMDEKLHHELREFSFKNNISMNDITIEALKEYFDKRREAEEADSK